MIEEWLKKYSPKTDADCRNALREIMQEVALAGLYRANFFKEAAFYGGTALRIFYKLPRYSEDLDFSLLAIRPSFKLEKYLGAVVLEFQSLGLNVTVKPKEKTNKTAIESAFLKAETSWHEIILEKTPALNFLKGAISMKIKFEVDTNPPLGFITEQKLLLKPFSCYINCFSLPDLFAGKMHALLFRKWKNRVKGRDWFDLEWYIKSEVKLNLKHLQERAIQSTDWDAKKEMTESDLRNLLKKKIKSVSFSSIKDDTKKFIPNPNELEIWNEQYFLDLIEHLQVYE